MSKIDRLQEIHWITDGISVKALEDCKKAETAIDQSRIIMEAGLRIAEYRREYSDVTEERRK